MIILTSFYYCIETLPTHLIAKFQLLTGTHHDTSTLGWKPLTKFNIQVVLDSRHHQKVYLYKTGKIKSTQCKVINWIWHLKVTRRLHEVTEWAISCVSSHMGMTKISHHDRKNDNTRILLNNEVIYLLLWSVNYEENLRGSDQLNFQIRVRIVGLLDLAYRNCGPTQHHIYEKTLWLRTSSLFHCKTFNH